MIVTLRLITRLITFAAACWILALILWRLATGAKHIDTPIVALWIFIIGLFAQLLLWLVNKVARAK